MIEEYVQTISINVKGLSVDKKKEIVFKAMEEKYGVPVRHD